jgi:hypothetical protein
MSVEAGRASKPDINDSDSSFEVENNNSAFSPSQLEKLYNSKSFAAFHALGGLEGLEKGLRTGRTVGMDETSLNYTISFEEATESKIVPVEGGATMPDDTGSHRVSLQPHPNCYPRFAAFMNSDENFLFYRKFSFLSNRVLFYRQEELRKLGQGLLSQDKVTNPRSLSRSVTASPLPGGLSLFSLITPSHAQGSAAGLHNKAELDWKQRALGALTDNLIMLAFLLFPLMVLTITGCAADRFRRNSQEGKAALSMLGMAVIFIAIPAPSGDKSASNNDQYMRGAVGLSYIFFMTVYYMLIAFRHRWYKGRCAIAGGLAILITTASMTSGSVQSYWTDSTKINPTFALAIAIPASFMLCDRIAYLSNAFNGARAPELPASVPGPQQGPDSGFNR